jgi:hypothetical protein
MHGYTHSVKDGNAAYDRMVQSYGEKYSLLPGSAL